MSEERDISFVYMIKDMEESEIDVRGGSSITDPVYCLKCPIDGKDWEMNLSQARDHVINIHKPRKHKVFRPGVERLKVNADRFKNHMAKKNAALQEELAKKKPVFS